MSLARLFVHLAPPGPSPRGHHAVVVARAKSRGACVVPTAEEVVVAVGVVGPIRLAAPAVDSVLAPARVAAQHGRELLCQHAHC